MSGSILVCTGLLSLLAQEPSLDIQQPSAMAAPNQLSYSDMVGRLHDYRWMLQTPRAGEGVKSHDLILEAGETKRLELVGPAAITHLMLSSQAGKVRFFVDGEFKPTLNWDLEVFAKEGVPEYLPYPIGMPLGLAWDTHLPLPFVASMVVEFEAPAASGMRVQCDVRDFGEGMVFDSVSEAVLKKEVAAIARVAEILVTGEHPPSLAQPDPFKVGATRMQAKNSETGHSGEYFWHFGGKGMLRWVEVTFIHKDPPAPVSEMLRGLEFRVEQGVASSVEEGEVLFRVPFGDFFGSSNGANPFQSYAVGLNAETSTFHMRLPIPYEDGMKLVISSEFTEYARLGVRVGLDPYVDEAVMPDMYLHSGWMRARETGVPKGATLKIEGPAHVAGYTFGSTSPTLQPMGQSGAFAFADYWTAPAPGSFQHVTRRDGPLGFGHNSMTRTFALDAPSGADGVTFHPGVFFPEGNGPTDYNALAWFYAPKGVKHSMATHFPMAQRMPAPLPEADFLVVADAMEAEEAPGVQITEGTSIEAKIVIDKTQAWSRLQFLRFVAQKPSDLVAFPFALKESGKYKVMVQMAKGEGYGQCELLIDGRVVGMLYDGAGEGLQPSGELEVVTMRMMARNDHSLAFRSLDGKAIGIDYFRVVPVKAEAAPETDAKDE